MFNDTHIAEVISIDDPDKLGRCQVRIKGLHDDKTNIPDKDCPWVTPMRPPTDPAINKIGLGGNPLLVGTTVSLKSWDYGKSNQNWYILGTIPKAGDVKMGMTKDFSVEIDTKKSDTPTASREDDKNTVVTNPIKDSKTTPGSKSDDDEGKNIYNDIAKKDAKFANNATIGSLKNISNDNLLETIKKVDPDNIGGSIKDAVKGLIKLKNLDSLTSSMGINNMVSSVVGNLFNNLMKSNGQQNATNSINNIMQNQAFNQDANSDVTNILQLALIKLENMQNDDSDIITLDSQDDIDEIINELIEYIKETYNIDGSNTDLLEEKLIEIIEMLLQKCKDSADTKALGSPQSNNLGNAPQSCNSDLMNTISSFLPKSLLDQSKIQEALQKFTKSHQILDKKENIIKEIFQNSNIQNLSNMINSDMIKNIIDPSSGNLIKNLIGK